MNENINQEMIQKKLLIELSCYDFSFSVYDKTIDNYSFFLKTPFDTKATTPIRLLQEVKNAFKKQPLLREVYQEILFIHQNDLNTMVPKSFFDKSILKAYLSSNVEVFNDDFINYDEIKSLEIFNVYVPFVNINNFIFDFFGSFTYLHSSAVFIENILKNCEIRSKKEMFVNVYTQNYHIVVLEGEKLIFSNHFGFETKEDFCYYILFVADQLRMDVNQFYLTVFGNIKEEDENYEKIYKYVKNVSIYTDLNIKSDKDTSWLPQESFNLLHYC